MTEFINFSRKIFTTLGYIVDWAILLLVLYILAVAIYDSLWGRKK